MAAYRRPRTLAEALALLAAVPAEQGAPLLLAGGTDIYPARAAAAAWLRDVTRPVLDLSGIAGLGAIEDAGGHHRIGAGVTWAMLRDRPLPVWFAALQAAARQIGGVQVQARGTLLGNLCNASPAADGVPPLLALDAEVELASLRGTRRLALGDFLLGNRRTALAPDEIATAVLVPKPEGSARSGFLKLGARAYLVISIVMVAGVVEITAGHISRARLAVGACSAVAQRLPPLEAALAGLPLVQAAAVVEPAHLAGLTPIDDVRATAEYRRHAALVLLRRLLAGLAAPEALAA